MSDEAIYKTTTVIILGDKLLVEADQGTVSKEQVGEALRLSHLHGEALAAFRASKTRITEAAYLAAADAFISYVEPLVKQQPE